MISDTATQQALAAAAHAQDTADGKRRVFTSTPFVPYDEGDLWVNANYGDGELVNELMRCNNSVDALGTFDVSDWEKASKYTDDTAAQAAQESADAANALLADIASDSKLTPGEKQQVKKEWDIIVGEKSKLDLQADEFHVSRAGYNAAYTQLNTYIGPLIADLTTTDTIVGASFRYGFKAYYDAKIDLLNAIATEAKDLANSAQMDAGDAMAAAQEALGDALVANQAIAYIASDNVLSPVEKSAERLRWNTIASEKAGIDAQATLAGLTTEKTAYGNAYQALATYLNNGTTWTTGVPTWLADANLGANCAIVGATYRTKWKDYYDTRTALLNAVSAAVKVLAESSDYLKAALQGSTDITGGILATTVLLMKTAAGLITGGMSGLADDNIGMWTGGTYEDAIGALAKVILRKDGSGQLAGGKILWDLLGALSVGAFKIEGGAMVGYDVTGADRVKLHTGSLITLAELAGGWNRNPTNFGWENLKSSSLDWRNETTSIVNRRNTYAVSAQLIIPSENMQLRLSIGTHNVNFDGPIQLLSVTPVYKIYKNGILVYTNSGNLVPIVNIPTGTYTVTLELVVVGNIAPSTWGVFSYIDSTSNYGYLELLQTISRTEIASDGFMSYWSDLIYLYFTQAGGLIYKGAMNIPGVLAAGSYSGVGGQDANKRWGSKSSVYDAGYTSVGQYRIPHAIGHSNYTAHITCGSSGAVGSIVARANAYVDIIIQRNGSNYQSAFDIMLIGNNN